MDGAATILVVDDDPSIRLLCRVNLELDGWVVREAATIPAARAALTEGDVSLVLLDAHVGSESGVDFLDELRRDRAGTPVVMLTGSVPAIALEIAPDASIEKPFTLEELTGTVERLVHR